MTIDFSQLFADRLKELDESGEIKTFLDDAIKRAIESSIKSALDSYEFRNKLREALCEGAHSVINDVGLTAYNQLIADRLRATLSDVVMPDMGNKIADVLTETVLQKHDGIKLSEIAERYRDFVFHDLDDEEKREKEQFMFSVEDVTNTTRAYSSNFTDYSVCFSEEDGDSHPNVSMKLLQFQDKPATISWIEFNGKAYFGRDSIRLNKFEAFVANLCLNKTGIIVDLDECYGFDTEYDVDW